MGRKVIRFIAIFTLICLLCALLGGCGDEAQGSQGASLSDQFTAAYEREEARLFFRQTGSGMLAGETRRLMVGATERLETVVLRELIAGPSAARTNLEALIHPRTLVLGVEEVNGILYVTFSSEFLTFPKSNPQDWAEDIILQNEAERKRLAVYSVVNTLAGLGEYSKVQILVDTDSTGVGKRLPAAEFGFESDDPQALLDVMNYDGACVLSPENSLAQVFECIIARDWDRLYGYIATLGMSGTARPSLEIARQVMDSYAPLRSYRIHDVLYDADGKGAVVFFGIELYSADIASVPKENLSLRVVQENEFWTVRLDALNNIFLG